jgi:hypothetical protein
MATQYSNKPIVTDGLVYALDFGNPKSYVSGSVTANSLVYRPTPARFETLLPGDYGTPAAAYSVRKVVSSYTGSAMMVQSASVSQSIGFDADGNLDTASLASFAGSGDAFVKIWYDQSGNGRDASQAVTANQPQIVSSGNVITEGGKPTIDHTRTQTLNISTNLNIGKIYSIFGIVKFDIQGAEIIGSSSPGYSYAIYADATNTYHSANSAFGSSNGVFGLNFALLSIHRDNSTTVSQYKNSTILGSTFTLIDNRDFYFRSLSGEQNNSYNLDGKLSEAIIYPSNQSSNRTKIEDNINTYYQIFTSSYNPTPDSDNNFLDFNGNNTLLNTQQSFPGFSYDQGNSTVMYVGETKGNSTTFTQDGNLSIVSTTSSVGFGSPSNTFGRSYPVTGLKHVALRFSSGSVDCFVNGVPVSASAIFPTGSSIGGGQLNIPLYTGSLGGFQIYNRPLTSDEIWNNYQLTAPRYGLGPVQNKPYILDENAYLFLQSAGITDPIITGSIDMFVRGLKSASLWDKMIAIYPFVGTGSTGINLTGSHRWNLKEPSLVTYPLTFTGSWIGSTSGSAPSGSGTNITMGGVTPTTLYPFYNTQSAHISILSYDTPVSSSYLMGTGMTEDLAISTLAGDYGTPAAAYSVRKVRTAYSGALMDVRRSLDNVTSSIGYVSNGDLDTGSLLNFVRTEGSSYLPGAYSGLAAAYSLRRVSASYDGPAIDVRRSYDNITGSVGFDSNGNLNTASLFTFVNVSENLLPYSQDLAKTGSSPNFLDGWASANLQVTASTIIAPDGTLTGNTVTTTSSFHYLASRISGSYQNQQMIFSFWAKTGSMTAAALSVYDITNAANIIAPTSYYSQITSGQWTYITASFTVPSTCIYFQVYPLRDSGVTGSIYIWGAQLRTSSYVDGYVRTTGSKATPGPVVFGTASHSFGYVNTWYDQSGNGRHATQVSSSKQPLIVSSGSLITNIGGKPTVYFNRSVLRSQTFTPVSVPITSFLVNQYRVFPTNGWYVIDQGADDGVLGYISGTSNKNEIYNGVYLTYTENIVTGSNYLWYALFSGSNSELNINNVGTVTGSSGTRQSDQISIGFYGGAEPTSGILDGYVSEFLSYHANVSSSRTLIENNINNYYNIYTGSNHGFVARWYDQSGNNRHATQTATGSQPIIVLSGSLLFENNKPALAFSSSILESPATSIQYAYSIINAKAPESYEGFIGFGPRHVFLRNDLTSNLYYSSTSLFPNMVTGTYVNNSQSVTFTDNTLQLFSAGSPTPTSTNQKILIGTDIAGGNPSVMSICESIFYNSDQTINREATSYGINSYYNIYPQTSSFATSSFTIKADSGSISASLNNRLTSGIAASGPLGLITVSRTGSNSLTIARNGVTSSFAVPASGALSTGIYLGAINNNGLALGNSPLNISFASVGTGLTGAESTKYFNLVNSLNYRLGRGVNAEYDTILEYAILQGYTLPSVDQQALQNQLISDLKNAGIWNKLDIFYVFATNGDQNFARLNWKNPSLYRTTNVTSDPIFRTNIGFTGPNRLNTNFPSTSGVNYTLNNASRHAWVYFSYGGNQRIDSAAISNDNTMENRNGSYQSINSSQVATVTNLSGTGMKSIHRLSSTSVIVLNGTTQQPYSAATTGLSASPQYIFGGTVDISMYSMGASLVNENLDYINAFQTYLTAISS